MRASLITIDKPILAQRFHNPIVVFHDLIYNRQDHIGLDIGKICVNIALHHGSKKFLSVMVVTTLIY